MSPQIDSNLTREEGVRAAPESGCPEDILLDQEMIDVKYFNFEGNECQGQVVVNKNVLADIQKVFELIHSIKFPLAKAVPIGDQKYMWNDDASCEDNNTSAFNYRVITGGTRLSSHALGYAIDFNPIQNPYSKYDGEGEEMLRIPKDSHYDINVPGTLHGEHEIVKLLKSLDWKWGGNWEKRNGPVDYQHFEKDI